MLKQRSFRRRIYFLIAVSAALSSCSYSSNPIEGFFDDSVQRPLEIDVITDCDVPTFYRNGDDIGSYVDVKLNREFCAATSREAAKIIFNSVSTGLAPEVTLTTIISGEPKNYESRVLERKSWYNENYRFRTDKRADNPQFIRLPYVIEAHDRQDLQLIYENLTRMKNPYYWKGHSSLWKTPGKKKIFLAVTGQLIDLELDKTTDIKMAVDVLSDMLISGVASDGNEVSWDSTNLNSHIYVQAYLLDEQGKLERFSFLNVGWNKLTPSYISFLMEKGKLKADTVAEGMGMKIAGVLTDALVTYCRDDERSQTYRGGSRNIEICDRWNDINPSDIGTPSQIK